MINFASDNCAPVHPKILQAMIQANEGFYPSYGEDSYTKKAEQLFKNIFGQESRTYFVVNGTGANILSLQSVCKPYSSILCSSEAHMANEEGGAPNVAGTLQPIFTSDGKLTPEKLIPYFHTLGIPYRAQPTVVSITQATEREKTYSIEETRAIATLAHDYGLYVHMDGARIANAAVALNVGFKEMTKDCGVDILSFGGSKNGLMMGEAVVFLNPELGKDFLYYMKHGLQQISKVRYITSAFIAYLQQDLWKELATHANNLASYLAEHLSSIDGVVIADVGVNSVFVNLPKTVISALEKDFYFYIWDDQLKNPDHAQIRLMTNFATKKEDIDQLCTTLRSAF